jgi:hypothetical protein
MGELPHVPVIVVHLEDPAGSGLAACCGLPFRIPPSDYYPHVPRWACTGCTRKAIGNA